MISPHQFVLRSNQQGSTQRLTPIGELDLASVPLLREAFERAYDNATIETIVVDLGELRFIDSAGVHLLLRMGVACKHDDCLRIINGTPAVERVLDLAGVRSQLPLIDRCAGLYRDRSAAQPARG